MSNTYMFDVPETGLNFRDMNEETTASVDAWFDLRAGALATPNMEKAAAILQTATMSRANVPRAIVSPMVKCNENCSNRETKEENTIPSNVVSSWGDNQGATSNAPAKAPGRLVIRRSAQRKSAQRMQLMKPQAEHCAAAAAAAAAAFVNEEGAPPPKKPRVSNAREKLGEIVLNNNVSPGRVQAKSAARTPKVPSTTLKSTEELQLEHMKQLQKEVAELRKKNEKSLKVAIAGSGQTLKKSVSNVTKPVDFHFSTDERIKQHSENQPGTEYKEVDFTAGLRKHPPSPARVAKGPTIPKPFNLSQGNKRKHDEAVSTYVSLAQQVEKFQKCTPPRYHLRSRKEEGLAPNRPLKAKLTHPRTPNFATKSRWRPTTCKSTAELEAEEFAQIQQYKFKAQELNPRILEGGLSLPKKLPAKEPTKPIGFDLEIEKRIQERESKKPPETEHFEFHSRPCPTKILEDVVGVPEKKLLPITVPQSPAFTLKNKASAPVREEEREQEEEVTPVIKAKPMPYFGVPFKPKATEPRQVEMCPFSFDSRDKARLLQKEKKIEELQKEEVPQFKAHPLPHFDHVVLPDKKVKSPTKPEPFQLELDRRGAVRHEMWQHQLKEEMKRQKEAASFKAQPSNVVHQEPFLPKKDSRPLSVPDTFELATERRTRERVEFEKRLVESEMKAAREQEEARRIEKERERKELARVREELVHKANPIRKFQKVDIKPSNLPLTVPKSPNFSDRFQC